jgi:hypothetical protein
MRCVGFTPGPNGTGALARQTHGAYSVVQIEGRAGEVAEALTDALVAEGLYRPAFAPAVSACAVVLVRLERAHAALDQVDERMEAEGGGPLAAYLGTIGEGDPLSKLRQDAARWANVARAHMADLGLTPASLARIAKDTGIAQQTRTQAALRALSEHVEGRAA